MTLWILIFFMTLPFSAYAKTKVYFADQCSGRETSVATPNGVKIQMNLAGLTKGLSVNLEVIIRPALSPESLHPNHIVKWNYRYRADDEGNLSDEIFLPKRKWMRKVEARYKNYRVWDAEITWNQPEAKLTGTTITSFYHAPETGPYFQVLSRSICYRQEKGEVTSKLYQNTTPHEMTVTQEMDSIWEQGSSLGMTLGYNNFQGNVHPLSQFSASSVFLGWLFRDWQVQSDTNQTAGFEAKYTLNQNDAGVFISRMSYNRHKVRRFEWNPDHGDCGGFVPVSSGYLDVGNKTKGNFVVVPANLAGRADEVTKFIERASPSINTCKMITGVDTHAPDDVLTSTPDGVLLYYTQDY
jgi:hypothetical protein